MSALQALSNLPVPTPAATTAVTPAVQGGPDDFAGILNAASAPVARDTDTGTLTGLAKRSRKAATQDSSEEAGDAGSGTADRERAGSGGSPAATPALDIATLAQLAATLVPARPQGGEPPTEAATGATVPAPSGTAAATGAAARETASRPTASLEAAADPAASTQSPATTAAWMPPRVSGTASSGSPETPGAESGEGPAAVADTRTAVPPPAVNTPSSSTSAQAAGGAAAAEPTSAQGDGQPPPPDLTKVPAPVATAGVAAQAGAEAGKTQAVSTAAAPATLSPGAAKPQAARSAATAANPTGVAGQPGRRAGSIGPALPEDADGEAGTTGPTPDASAGLAAAAPSGLVTPTEPPASPAQQVVTALQSLVPQPAATVVGEPAATSAASAAPPLQAAVTTAPGVRTVTIQLDPGHLGPVSVTLRMKADAVDIQIAVSNPQALHLLERDRHVLAAVVESLGGSATALHLGKADVSADGGATLSNPSFTPPGGFSRQDSSSDAASTGRGNGNRSATRHDTSQNDSDEPTSAPPAAPIRARDGSLYL